MLKRVWTILREAASEWMEDNATRLSAALAFYTILSVAPLLVIVTAIAGLVLGDEAASGRLTEEIRGFVGDAGAEVVKTTIEHADRPKSGLLASIIGIVTLLFGASGVFGELQAAMNIVWNVKPKPGRGIWATVKDRFLSFGMVLVVGFLLLVSLVITTAMSAVGDYLGGLLPGIPTLMHIANFVLSFAVVTILFALIFKFLPDARIAWRDVWFGALVTAALFTLGKYLIGLYLGKAAPGSAFGAAGSVVAFVIWVYYSGLILFFGAELTQVSAKHAGRQIVPTENAERVGEKDKKAPQVDWKCEPGCKHPGPHDDWATVMYFGPTGEGAAAGTGLRGGANTPHPHHRGLHPGRTDDFHSNPQNRIRADSRNVHRLCAKGTRTSERKTRL